MPSVPPEWTTYWPDPSPAPETPQGPPHPSELRKSRRRRVVRALLATGALSALGLPGVLIASSAPGPPARWSDPATWAGSVPGPTTVVTVDRPILVDADPQVAGVIVTANGSLIFDPAATHTLRSTGNIVNDGLIVMHPANPAVIQSIQFVGVNEKAFLGGTGRTPVASDVGLWTETAGRLDLSGAPKTPWTYADGPIERGTTQLTVHDTTGWRVGDELVITPTSAPGPMASWNYDAAVLTAVSGRNITLSRPTTHGHPSVTVAPGQTFSAEVLNLTRNVRIWGQPGHRAHVWIHSSVPTAHVVNYVDIRFMGPRQAYPDGTTVGVLGRYGLHFHDSMGNTAGSVVIGTVVRDSGFHAFVPHMSDGITFKNDISHNTFDEAYWWDPQPSSSQVQNPTNHLTFDHCVASLVNVDPPFRGARLAGFVLGRGLGNVARGNVAVGVQGNGQASGFQWPEELNGSEGTWTFEDNVAHNNAQNGIFVWQNTSNQHVINRFTGYYNGTFGIMHGAYGNAYRYENSVLYGNAGAAVDLPAESNGEGTGRQLEFVNMLLDGAGLSDYLITTDQHNPSAGGRGRTRVLNSTLRGYRRAGVGVVYAPADSSQESATAPEAIDFVGDTWSGNEFWFVNGVMAQSRLRVEDAVHPSQELRPVDRTKPPPVGVTYRPAWNANVQRVAAFATDLINGAPPLSRGAAPAAMFCTIP